jgi:acetoin:2,6-dichlorophenolindophenol oxidoreductase subunit alpha
VTNGIDGALARKIYQKLCEVRAFEQACARLYRESELPGFIHVSLGQEACAVGACLALEQRDYVTSTHRGHGHCLAKGADPDRMMAELFARPEGYSKGRGGSMHIADISVGVLGANGIVGQSSPLAIGAALTSQVKNLGSVALAFFGEGASGAGPTYEAMNIAALWKLPVVFFCEVNRYAELSPFTTHCPTKNVADRAVAFGMPGVVVDGNDVVAVYDAVRTAADRARKGMGPSIVEAKTHRWHGHYEGDPMAYVADADKDEARRDDPLLRFAAIAPGSYGINAGELAEIARKAEHRIDDAISYARGLQSPPVSVMMEDVYA